MPIHHIDQYFFSDYIRDIDGLVFCIYLENIVGIRDFLFFFKIPGKLRKGDIMFFAFKFHLAFERCKDRLDTIIEIVERELDMKGSDELEILVESCGDITLELEILFIANKAGRKRSDGDGKK
jgi:hypothetical protein